MKKLGRALQAGAKGFSKALEPGRYQAAGLQVRCTHCKGELFRQQEAMLNTAGMTLMNLDWLNKSGTALICEKCALIQWFGTPPERMAG